MSVNRSEDYIKNSLISIMMPAYNVDQYIGEAIESVLAQSYPYWELIIVNDGSTDGTKEKSVQYSDERIKIINQDNQGESAARNAAFGTIQGNYLAFLDADDMYLPEHLERTAKYLDDHPDVDGVYTDGYYCDQNGNRLQSLSSRRRGPFEGRIYEEVVYGSDVFGPPVCVVLRRDLITKHNLEFDENITIGPDWDFFIQYSDLARFGYISEYTCEYRLHKENISFQIDLQKRSLEMAKCREKSIKMKNFKDCSLRTKWNVFYDLLVYLLHGLPVRQAEVTSWKEFKSLPIDYQAKLFRLMAGGEILGGAKSEYVEEWLHTSRRLNPADWRGMLLHTVYRANPHLCQLLIRILRPRQFNIPPFSDMNTTLTVKQ